MKIIIWIMITISILNADFTRNATTNIVTDSVMQLEWQDDVIGSEVTWEGAISSCEFLALDGGGWRLPNINELKTIVDYTRVNPAMQSVFSQTFSTGGYWSSTSNINAGSEHEAFYIYIYRGEIFSYSKLYTSKQYARCVRGGVI